MNTAALQDQVVLMIGAGRAPAPVLAQALANEGAILALNDLSPVLLEPPTEAIRQQGGRAKAYPADATRGMPLRSMLDEILEDWGKIDILINNPRIAPETPLLDMDEWDWQRTVEMNLNGPFLVSKLVARLMQEQGQGQIINIVDVNPTALQSAGRAAYAASQQGFLAFSQAAAREFLAYNIQVTTLCPDEALFLSTTDPAAFDHSSWTRTIVELCASRKQAPNGQILRIGLD